MCNWLFCVDWILLRCYYNHQRIFKKTLWIGKTKFKLSYLMGHNFLFQKKMLHKKYMIDLINLDVTKGHACRCCMNSIDISLFELMYNECNWFAPLGSTSVSVYLFWKLVLLPIAHYFQFGWYDTSPCFSLFLSAKLLLLAKDWTKKFHVADYIYLNMVAWTWLQ